MFDSPFGRQDTEIRCRGEGYALAAWNLRRAAAFLGDCGKEITKGYL
jgi:hypothetical protein